MTTCCIFDLDGVIVDTAKYHYLAWKRLANSLGFDFSEADNEHLKGVSRIESLKIILKLGAVELDQAAFDAALADKNGWYLEYINQIGPEEILPGVSEFLSKVRASGIQTALGSASKNAVLILERIALLDLLDRCAVALEVLGADSPIGKSLMRECSSVLEKTKEPK